MAFATRALENFFGYKTQLHSVGDKHWCCVKLNDPNKQYGFNGKDFTIQFKTVTGFIDGDDHWLVGTVLDSEVMDGGVYELTISKPGTEVNPTTGKAKYVTDEAGTKDIRDKWKASGNLFAILCNDLHTAKCLVIALANKKFIAENPVKFELATLTKEQSDSMVKKMENCLSLYLTSGVPVKDTPEYTEFMMLATLGVFVRPIASEELVPKIEYRDVLGMLTDTRSLCIPYKGKLPTYDSIEFTPPTTNGKKGYGGNNGTPAYTPAERLTWVCDALKASNVPLESNTIESLHNAISKNEAHAVYYHMAIQLSGVSVSLPSVSSIPPNTQPVTNPVPSFDSTINMRVDEILKNGNGHKSETKTLVEEYKGWLTRHGLIESDERIDARSVEEIKLLVKILSSETYCKQLSDLGVWIITNLGTTESILSMKLPTLKKVAKGIEANDSVLPINPAQNILSIAA